MSSPVVEIRTQEDKGVGRQRRDARKHLVVGQRRRVLDLPFARQRGERIGRRRVEGNLPVVRTGHQEQTPRPGKEGEPVPNRPGDVGPVRKVQDGVRRPAPSDGRLLDKGGQYRCTGRREVVALLGQKLQRRLVDDHHETHVGLCELVAQQGGKRDTSTRIVGTCEVEVFNVQVADTDALVLQGRNGAGDHGIRHREAVLHPGKNEYVLATRSLGRGGARDADITGDGCGRGPGRQGERREQSDREGRSENLHRVDAPGPNDAGCGASHGRT